MTPQHRSTTRPASPGRRCSRRRSSQACLLVVRRNLLHIRRMPELLMDVTIQPVMFVLLFAFVFGASIDVPGGGSYREFLIPGIMAQTMVFSSFIVAIGLVNDLEKGFVDRLKALPIHRVVDPGRPQPVQPHPLLASASPSWR